MATLNFPPNPVNGQIYPSTPIEGQKVYSWSAPYQTWLLIGTFTGVVAGTYGGPQTVGRFTVDLGGRLTFAEDVDIQIATEQLAGISQIATQAEVNDGTNDGKFVTPLKLSNYVGSGGVPASSIPVTPPINGNTTVQEALEDAIYNVASSNSTITVTESATGLVDVALPPVGASGSYSYASVTVDQQGRVTAASTNTTPNTTVINPLTNTGTTVQPVIGILSSSITQAGAVRLATTVETQTGADPSLAVTPAGLSSRIATETRTGLAEVATQVEVNSGTDNSRFVTPLTLATYVNGGGSGQLYHYVQLDDVSSGFNGSETVFNLSVGGTAYTPTPPSNLMVFLGGIAQIPGGANAYTVSGSTITFVEAPASGTTFYATTVSSN